MSACRTECRSACGEAWWLALDEPFGALDAKVRQEDVAVIQVELARNEFDGRPVTVGERVYVKPRKQRVFAPAQARPG